MMNFNRMAPRGQMNKLALLGVVGYFAWKYRFQIQETLESAGIKTPWLNGNLDEAVQSGSAKVTGKLRRAFSDDDRQQLQH